MLPLVDVAGRCGESTGDGEVSWRIDPDLLTPTQQILPMRGTWWSSDTRHDIWVPLGIREFDRAPNLLE